MSIASVTPRPSSAQKTKYLLGAFFVAMFCYVIVHNESFLLNLRAPVWQHYQPFKWWLLPHGIAGACALLLGPMQFSDRLRQRYAKLHRVAGRLYVAGAVIASPMGLIIESIQVRHGDPIGMLMIPIAHGGLWMLTTGIAFLFILQGKVQQHRQWMTRSFFVGPGVFLGARVILGLAGIEPSSSMYQAVIWFCIASAVPLADVLLQWQERPQRRGAPAKALAVAP